MLENDSCHSKVGRARASLKYTGFACLDRWTIKESLKARERKREEDEKRSRKKITVSNINFELKGARHLTDSIVLDLPKGRDIYIYCLIRASLFHKSEKQL